MFRTWRTTYRGAHLVASWAGLALILSGCARAAGMNSGGGPIGSTTSAGATANPLATALGAGARCSDSPAAMEVTGPDWDLPATPTADAAEVDELTRELAQAYEQRSTKALARYFEKWELAATALPPESRANLDATTRAAYETFERVYTPWDHSALGYSEFGEMYSSQRYVVAPGVIGVLCYDALIDPMAWMEDPEGETEADPNTVVLVNDFRPRITPPGVEGQEPAMRVVYLTPAYEAAITAFLAGDFTPMGSGSVMAPAGAGPQGQAKIDFLEGFIHVVPGHWGGYWHVISHPEIWAVSLTEDLTQASIGYRIGYQGGDAVLDRDPAGAWQLTSAGLSWIE